MVVMVVVPCLYCTCTAQYVGMVLRTLEKFLASSDASVMACHIPRGGIAFYEYPDLTVAAQVLPACLPACLLQTCICGVAEEHVFGTQG